MIGLAIAMQVLGTSFGTTRVSYTTLLSEKHNSDNWALADIEVNGNLILLGYLDKFLGIIDNFNLVRKTSILLNIVRKASILFQTL